MRDFIWTLIIIWTVYQLSSLFRNRSKKQKTSSSFTFRHKVKNSESSLRKAGNEEGEYVDFEELK